MATCRILYWQEIPSQIKTEDDQDEVTLPLEARFQERIDRLATERGLQAADDYLDQWRWGEEFDREGTAQEAADAVRAELEAQAGSEPVESAEW